MTAVHRCWFPVKLFSHPVLYISVSLLTRAAILLLQQVHSGKFLKPLHLLCGLKGCPHSSYTYTQHGKREWGRVRVGQHWVDVLWVLQISGSEGENRKCLLPDDVGITFSHSFSHSQSVPYLKPNLYTQETLRRVHHAA